MPSLRLFVASWLSVLAACSTSADEPLPATTSQASALLAHLPERSAQPTSQLSPDATSGFEREERGLTLRLPARASGAVALRARGVEVELRRQGASDEPAQLLDGQVVYADERGGGTVLRPLVDGVEDFVRLLARPADGDQLVYDLALGAGARGLRQIGGWLEVVDERGVPRLRMEPPYIVEASGQRRPAGVEVRGCEVDRSAAAPWGRPVVAPGAPRCAVVVSWAGQGATYPLLVDPAWRTTGTMVQAREWHGATRLTSGDVLLVGGSPSPQAELYKVPAEDAYDDPGVFTPTGSIPQGDLYELALATLGETGSWGSLGVPELPALPLGGAVLHGGRWQLSKNSSQILAQTLIYDTKTGLWLSGPSSGTPMASHAFVQVAKGWLFAGGRGEFGDTSGDVRFYDPSAGPLGGWAKRSDLLTPRKHHGVASTKVGRVLVAGGSYGGLLSSTEIYDVATDTWTAGPELTVARQDLTATALDDGEVLVAGGRVGSQGNFGLFTKRVERIDTQTGSLTPMHDLFALRGLHAAQRLQNGSVLVAGGAGFIEWIPSAELYDPTTPGSPPGSSINYETSARVNLTLTGLGGTRALMAGGSFQYGTLNSALVFQLRPNGAPCGSAEQCRSRLCVDDVCCNQACDGECEGCRQEVRGGDQPDGECAVRAAGKKARAVAQPACQPSADPCGYNGACNGTSAGGAEACQLQVAGTRCSEQICSSPDYTFKVCDGQGKCDVETCAPYAHCQNQDACAKSCLQDIQCIAGYFCSAQGTCEPLGGPGVSCADGGECASGFCVDGVCCDSSCTGDCRACSKAAKGQGQDGVCEPVQAGLITGDCVPQAPATCGRTGACGGDGTCAQYGAETSCGQEGVCELQATGQAARFSFHCAEGACVPELSESCQLYLCADASVCAKSCADDQGCVASAYCADGSCVARKADGSACAVARECQSGACSDGVCCNRVCDGQCETCTQPGSLGTCLVAKGPAPAGRPACSQGQEVCAARSCDGATGKTCAGYVGAEVSCAPATCKDRATRLAAATCAGSGFCQTQAEVSCAPYGCDAGKCREVCASDADCAAQTRCEGGRCIPSAHCEDTTTLIQADGTAHSCAPFRCDSGELTCLSRCTSSADCIPGRVCTSAGACEAPLVPEENSSTGCSLPARPTRGSAPLALGLLAALGWARRRRALGALLAALPLGCSSGETPAAPPASALAPAPPVAWPASVPPEASVATGYDDEGGMLRPRLPGAAGSPVRLPRRADGPIELRDAGGAMQLAVRLLDAHPAEATWSPGRLVYPDALGPGGFVLQRPSPQGTEDFVRVVDASARTSLRYEVALGAGVAGLRLVAGALEFLDARGAPRLRMAPPYALTDAGERMAVAVDVEGCEADRSAVAPWGRLVVAPGQAACEVRLSWTPRAGALLVDPAWQQTGSMSSPHALHTATKLFDGRVLVAGGTIQSFDTGAVSSSELYDPATGTWAQTGSMNFAHSWQSDWRLPDGKVLVAGGNSTQAELSRYAEIYDPATGLWTLTGALPQGRYSHASATLPDGRPFMAGGYIYDPSDTFFDDAYAYDLATSSWTKLPGKMLKRRRYSLAFPIPGDRILVAAGKYNPSGSQEVFTTSTEIYDVSAGVWTAGPDMVKARQLPAATITPEGILFAGGIASSFPPVLDRVELFRFSDETFVDLGAMSAPRALATALWLASENRALIAGGANATNTVATSELVATTSSPSVAAGSMQTERAAHTATLLDSGLVLVAGGGKASLGAITGATATSEVFSTLQIGQPCLADGQCPQVDPKDSGSRHCVDGVCCNSACVGVCRACSAAKKGSGADGACGDIQADSDPDEECPANGKESCGTTGTCDGAGQCRTYDATTVCAQSCDAGQVTTGHCTQGTCQLVTASCQPYTCDSDNQLFCRASCQDTSHCSSSTYCDLSSATCLPRLAQGASCTADDSCLSGFCVDGVCCNQACDQACEACSAQAQGNPPGAQDGLCAWVAQSQPDPRALCQDVPCDHHATCDGQGACLPYQEQETCSQPLCVGNASIGFQLSRFTCHAKACVPTADSPLDCGDYLCVDQACLTSCDSNQDCSAKAYCAEGQCTARKPDGSTCFTKSECQSGFCVDGVCCNQKCEEQCAVCNSVGQAGRCVPTLGAPAGGRPACAPATAAEPCEQHLCDGKNTKECDGMVGSDQVCSLPRCADGQSFKSAVCDGHGACGKPVQRNCFPYVCGAEDCTASCTDDTGCATGTRCEQGACVGALTCDAERSVIRDSTGAIVKECGLYRCDPTGVCRTSCQSSAQCSDGAVCTSRGDCAPPALTAPTDPGCACRTTASPAPLSPALWLLSLLGLRTLRRSPRRS